MCDPVSIVTGIVGVGGIAASVSAGNQQADAINASTAASTQATQQSIDFARDAQGIAAEEMAPYANTGAQANAAIAAMLGLPGPSVARPAAQPGGASAGASGAASAGALYLQQNPDVQAAYMAERNKPGSRFYGASPDTFAEWHYANYGQVEGRSYGQPAPQQPGQPGQPTAPGDKSGLDANGRPITIREAPRPGFGAPPTNPAAAGFESSPFGTMVRDAANTFESSPFMQIANDEIDAAISNLDGRYGASGLILSGGATRARAEIAAQIRGDLFNQHLGARTANFADYFGALTNANNTGFQAASGVASGGQAFANAASNAVQNNAAAQSNAAIAAAGARADGVNSAVGFGGWALGNLLNNRSPTTFGSQAPMSTASGPSTTATTLSPVVPTYNFPGG